MLDPNIQAAGPSRGFSRARSHPRPQLGSPLVRAGGLVLRLVSLPARDREVGVARGLGAQVFTDCGEAPRAHRGNRIAFGPSQPMTLRGMPLLTRYGGAAPFSRCNKRLRFVVG